MQLFSSQKGKLSPAKNIPFKLESDIHTLVEENLETLFNLELVKREFKVNGYRIDTLCFDKECNAFVILEYKKTKSYSVMDQGYTYLSIMLNNKADFILEYNENMGVALQKKDVDWRQSRVVFISPSFTGYQQQSIEFGDIPFELWEIKQFSNQTIVLNRHRSTSTESVSAISKTDNLVSSVSKEVQVYNIDDHRSKGEDEVQELFDTFCSRILELDDIEIIPTKGYVAFKVGKRVVSDCEVKKEYLKLRINMKWGTLDDPKKLFRDVSSIGHWGVGDYECKIKNDTDLYYIMSLIKDCYHKITSSE
jgi:predicted transport protein